MPRSVLGYTGSLPTKEFHISKGHLLCMHVFWLHWVVEGRILFVYKCRLWPGLPNMTQLTLPLLHLWTFDWGTPENICTLDFIFSEPGHLHLTYASRDVLKLKCCFHRLQRIEFPEPQRCGFPTPPPPSSPAPQLSVFSAQTSSSTCWLLHSELAFPEIILQTGSAPPPPEFQAKICKLTFPETILGTSLQILHLPWPAGKKFSCICPAPGLPVHA